MKTVLQTLLAVVVLLVIAGDAAAAIWHVDFTLTVDDLPELEYPEYPPIEQATLGQQFFGSFNYDDAELTNGDGALYMEEADNIYHEIVATGLMDLQVEIFGRTYGLPDTNDVTDTGPLIIVEDNQVTGILNFLIAAGSDHDGIYINGFSTNDAPFVIATNVNDGSGYINASALGSIAFSAPVVFAVPEPTTLGMLLLAGPAVLRRRGA